MPNDAQRWSNYDHKIFVLPLIIGKSDNMVDESLILITFRNFEPRVLLETFYQNAIVFINSANFYIEII